MCRDSRSSRECVESPFHPNGLFFVRGATRRGLPTQSFLNVPECLTMPRRAPTHPAWEEPP
ncbi:hypothetical protein BN2475_320033 [Paraburkholderia ribeironis]|uniref:Uncharacterized protein n=1 Tax=Paraburkholderia ribeironis TaxID=1247936 RepID=A0A1N7S345_9BURK|nr:hypothetical protein BN2475_320033 [Paraburkholderia ribeironis]